MPRSVRSALPAGVVTFLLTEVEGFSLRRSGPDETAIVLSRQADLISQAVATHGGLQAIDRGEAGATMSVFVRPSAAVAAAVDAQRALAAAVWPRGARVRSRMAIHTGEAEPGDDGLYGGSETLARCARLLDLARGGHVLVSNATAALTSDRLPPGASLVAVSRSVPGGLDRLDRVYHLKHPELDGIPTSLRGAGDHGLPRWPTPLVGREREIAEVRALFENGRVVTITGAGGAGKSRLAREVAASLADRFRDGAVWAELAPATAATHVAATVAAACGVPAAPGVSAEAALLHHLGKGETLVVLDNCEHLLDDCAALVDAIVREAPDVKILVTSREPLAAGGEVTWRIPSLAVPGESVRGVAAWMTFDAVRLFVERGRAAEPDFHVDEESGALIAHVCRRLDGMPLAIELAAARLRSLSIRQLADGLDDRFCLLTGGARKAVARQRTLLASVEWSYELLDTQERALFRHLGIFEAPFTIDAAEAVGEDDDLDRLDVLQVLGRLVEKSLVQRTGERYRLLETLRQFALERAADAHELVALRDRHLAWCRRRSREWGLDRAPATFAMLAEIGRELRDLTAALEWSLDPRRQPAVEILDPLGVYYTTAYLDFDDLRALAAAVLARYEEGSVEWLTALGPMALALVFAVDVAWLPAAERALDRVGDRLDPLVRGRVEFARSQMLAYFGREEGFAGLRRAIDDARAGGSRGLELHATAALALYNADNGDCAAARSLLAWLERQVPSDLWARQLVDIARITVLTYTGRLDDARIGLLASFEAEPGPYGLRRAGDVPLAAALGCWMVDVDLCRRAVAEAERTSATGLFELIVKDVPSILLALVRDEVDEALRLTTAGLRKESFGGHRLWIRCESGQMGLTLGDLAHAEAAFASIVPHLADANLYLVRVSANVLGAQVAAARGDLVLAESRAHEALACAMERELSLPAVDALETLVVLLADTEREAEAARLLGAAEAFRARSGYRWRYPHQRRGLGALRNRLDPAHVAEGEGMSLAEAAAYVHRGRGERGRPSRGWESLTPSEARVVALVAAGLPNREIAAKLFVSLATVKTHLVHVYGKLDLRTRAELAAAATRRALADPSIDD